MNWKNIFLIFTIALFLFIFIMSGYQYREGLTRKQKKRQVKGAINGVVRENNNIINQLNQIGDLIYNTFNPKNPRKTPLISSTDWKSNSSNKRSAKSPRRTPSKKGKISSANKSKARSPAKSPAKSQAKSPARSPAKAPAKSPARSPAKSRAKSKRR